MNEPTTPQIPEAASATAAANRPVILRGLWLFAARAVWVLLALLTLTILAILATRSTRLLLLEDDISDGYAALAGLMNYAIYIRIVLAARYVTLAAYLLTAVFIFWRKSDDLMGLITSLVLLVLPLVFNLGGLVPDPNLTAYRGEIDTILGLSWLLALISFPALFFFLNVFPTGRFPTRWARRLLVAGMGLLVVLLIANMFMGQRESALLALLALLAVGAVAGMLVSSLAAQIYRYRHISGPVERQQIRWVFTSLSLVLFWFATFYNQSPFRSYETWSGPWALFKIFGTVVILALLPLSITRAILRYHLWDIDVIVRKTLVYAVLTGSLILVYFTSIVVLQGAFSRLTGQDSTLATILSTLLIAALFLPLRRSVQDLIDRRFYRRKYDAAKVLEGFAATARDETDLEKLTAELLRVIQETMEPEHVSVWLRDTKDERLKKN
ncbi:MAG: hypothetical protein KA586_09315 [Candidatus Promineofilum sp.]|nr:hypothetical protein [Promineifilum sp.]